MKTFICGHGFREKWIRGNLLFNGGLENMDETMVEHPEDTGIVTIILL